MAEISELVMTTVMTIYLFNISDKSNNETENGQETELDQIYKGWKGETCLVGSKLHAYFPKFKEGKNPIHVRWRLFSDRLSEYYIHHRAKAQEKDLEQLEQVKEVLFDEKANIIAAILTSKITGFKYSYPQKDPVQYTLDDVLKSY